MRKTLLLLTTMALALLLAAGVALAATVTCQVGVACNGTSSGDTITGTNSNDTIKGLGGNDSISARDGIDKINGGPKNDTMDGGLGNDTYQFADNWGADRISADSGGVDTLNFAALTSTFTGGGGVTVNLNSDGSTLCPPTANGCFSIAGSFIENLVGTRFNDNLTGNPSKNQFTGGAGTDLMFGQAGNDTYKGYGTAPASGVDNINDTAGSLDKLNLASFNKGCGDQPAPGPGCNPQFTYGTNGGDVVNHLVMDFADGSSIWLFNYFDGTVTGPEFCASGSGPGLIETIIFADDSNVDFDQVMNDPRIGDCAPPAAGADSPAGVQQQPQGSIQGVVLQTPEPSTSSATLTAGLQR
jgi:Ca2+-binding RTX toxin-like protein